MNILIVDDREDNRYLLESMLKGNGHDVQSASNGEEALEKIKAGGVEMIISDILMPVMDGFQLCRKIKTTDELYHIPFVIYTATYTGPQDKAFAMKIGADRFIVKPCEPDAFMEEIQEVMAAANRRDISSKPAPVHEEEMLKLYSERLVKKLEQKMMQLEKEVQARKAAEDALHQRNAFLELLLETIPAPVYYKNTDGIYMGCNRAFEKFIGLDRAKIIEKRVFDIGPKEIADECAKKDNELFSHQREQRFEWKIMTNNGLREVIFNKAFFPGTHDQMGGIIGVVTDITEQKQATEALEASERKFRMLADNISDIIWAIDPNLTITYVNDSIRNVTGHLPEEWIGSELKVHCDENNFARLSRAIFSEIAKGQGGSGVVMEAEILDKNQKPVPVEIHGRTVFDKNGEPIYLQGVVRDISERRRTEKEREKLQEQLQQAQKMEAIGTLAGGIAHDFNNILAAIIGYAELALSRSASDSPIEKDLNGVLVAGRRARELVRQILTFSRQTHQEKMPVQTSLIAREALKLIRSSLPVTIDIRQNIQSKSNILSDPTRIHQIIMNLCTNAAYAMREKGGILEITLTDVILDSDFASAYPEILPGTYQKFTISDTGHGMTQEVIDRAFDPFFTTKPKDEGTGLGLSVVHGIVKDTGGTITVYSEPGKGTSFNLFFPIVETRIEEKSGECVNIPTGTESILVVDDEKAIIDLTKRTLTSLGYTVEVRASSLEALELFKTMPNKFDLVITDMTMPQMTGDKLSWELMKIRSDIPVILCTGFSEKISIKTAESIGIKAFLMKPLLKEEMAHTIRRVLNEVKNPSQNSFSGGETRSGVNY